MSISYNTIQDSIRYQVEEQGFQTRQSRYGIVLLLDEEIDITVTRFSIEPFGLLARIGGIIGVGQTLVSVFMFCLDYLISFFAKRLKLC